MCTKHSAEVVAGSLTNRQLFAELGNGLMLCHNASSLHSHYKFWSFVFVFRLTLPLSVFLMFSCLFFFSFRCCLYYCANDALMPLAMSTNYFRSIHSLLFTEFSHSNQINCLSDNFSGVRKIYPFIYL